MNWVTWTGGEAPLPHDAPVAVRLRDGTEWKGFAHNFNWHHSDEPRDFDTVAYLSLSSDWRPYSRDSKDQPFNYDAIDIKWVGSDDEPITCNWNTLPEWLNTAGLIWRPAQSQPSQTSRAK